MSRSKGWSDRVLLTTAIRCIDSQSRDVPENRAHRLASIESATAVQIRKALFLDSSEEVLGGMGVICATANGRTESDGPTGPMGPVGATGAQGPIVPTGPQGTNGTMDGRQNQILVTGCGESRTTV